MYKYICLCIHVYVYTYVYIYIYIYVSMCIYINTNSLETGSCVDDLPLQQCSAQMFVFRNMRFPFSNVVPPR